MQVRPKHAGDAAWIGEVLRRFWAGPLVVAGAGLVIDASRLPALIAGDREGLASYAIAVDGRTAELVTLNALAPRRGVGTALVEALAARLGRAGVGELWVSMTNDNLDALRFYQRRGFRLIAVHPGAIDLARLAKPAIPAVGAYGIPVRDRLDLVRALAPSPG